MGKRGEGSNTKVWVSQERKDHFWEKKNSFSYFFKNFILIKSIKIAGTSFKYKKSLYSIKKKFITVISKQLLEMLEIVVVTI